MLYPPIKVSERETRKDLGRGQEPGQEMATITAAVVKRGPDSCPLGGLGGGMEDPLSEYRCPVDGWSWRWW